MVKKNTGSELVKLRGMIQNIDVISQKQQDALLKQVDAVNKTVKVPKVKTNADSQFIKPIKVSDAMCDFAGWEKPSMKSRVDITKKICEYIKVNELQVPENKKNIRLDGTLKTLLGVDFDIITYPKIQQHIGHHLIKEPR